MKKIPKMVIKAEKFRKSVSTGKKKLFSTKNLAHIVKFSPQESEPLFHREKKMTCFTKEFRVLFLENVSVQIPGVWSFTVRGRIRLNMLEMLEI